MLSDIEIAQATKLIPIDQLAHEAGLVGKLVNRNELGCLSNFNIAEHGISQKGKCLKKLKTDGLRHGPGASGARP